MENSTSVDQVSAEMILVLEDKKVTEFRNKVCDTG